MKSLRIVFALALAVAACTVRAATTDRPNILFIMADDHAAHAISAYGSKLNKTPNIDRIANDGMIFQNCFVVNSICTPSRAAILTGKYSHKNGVPVFNRFNGKQWTVAKELQKNGYYTGMIGKWHLGSDPTGFDYWNILPGQGVYHDPVFIEMGEHKKHEGEYATDVITDSSIQFLENRPKDKPFFLMCHHKAPHRPWEPDAKHEHMYDNVDFPEPVTFNDDYSTRGSAAKEATMRVDRDLTRRDLKLTPPPDLKGKQRGEWEKTKPEEVTVTINGKEQTLTGAALKHWKYEKYMHDYLSCIASVDDNVGRLLDYLEKHDLAKNTIVIYTSDQGFFLGDHDWFDKRFMYEESLRMPFLIRYPGHIKPHSTNDKMILNVDFAPTFLEYAGVKAPEEVQGHSIVPLLNGQTPKDWRTSMYYRYYHYPADHRVQPHWGVRTEQYKLIYFNRIKEWELYDLKNDPHELHNVYEDSKYATVREDLKKEIERLRKQLDDRDQFADIQN